MLLKSVIAQQQRANINQFLSAPVILQSLTGYRFYDFEWGSVSGATSYDVLKNGVIVGTTINTSYELSDLEPGLTYNISLRARNSNSTSSLTSEEVITPFPANTGNHIATETDAAYMKNVTAGDVIIQVATGGGSLFITPSTNIDGQPITLGPGQKLHVRGEYITSDITLGDTCTGTLENPIIITNTDGQWKTQRRIDDSAGTTFKVAAVCPFDVTGVYDPIAGTGHPNYTGWFGGYRWRHGKFGILIDGGFNPQPTPNCRIYQMDHPNNPKYVRMLGIESRNGSASLFALKYDIHAVTPEPTPQQIKDEYDWVGAECMYNFAHDGKNEGFYIGGSQLPAHNMGALKFKYNVAVRCGTEGVQAKHYSAGSELELFCSILNAMAWKNVFQNFQNHGGIWDHRSEALHQKFVILGAGETGLFVKQLDEMGDATRNNGGQAIVRDFYITDIRNQGAFIGNSGLSVDGEPATPLVISNGKFRNIMSNFNEVYPDGFGVPPPQNDYVTTRGGTGRQVTIQDCEYDSQGGTRVFMPTGTNLTLSNNIVNDNIPEIEFQSNNYPEGLNPEIFEYWVDMLGEELNFTPYTGTNKTTPCYSTSANGNGNVDINFTSQTEIQLDELPLDKNSNPIDLSNFIGHEFRIADQSNKYDNFCIATLAAIDAVNKRYTFNVPVYVNNPGVYANIVIDKSAAYVTYNQNDIVLKDGMHYKMIFTGNKYLTAGRSPETETFYWQLMTWVNDEGATVYLPPDDWRTKQDSFGGIGFPGV